MNAVCFKCGGEKSAAIKLCRQCGELPTQREDLITSLCLSSQCIRQENLIISSKYIKKKNTPPGFHYKVIKKAIEIADAMPKDFQVSQSFDWTEGFIDEAVMVE